MTDFVPYINRALYHSLDESRGDDMLHDTELVIQHYTIKPLRQRWLNGLMRSAVWPTM